MTTALELITDASEDLGYKSAEVPLEAADIQLGLRMLNDMLAEWNDSGIKLGASPVDKPADTVRIPRGAVGAVKANLAGRLSVPFKQPITPELSSVIRTSTQALLRMVVGPIEVDYPSTLPTGAGNQNSSYDDDRLFSRNEGENF